MIRIFFVSSLLAIGLSESQFRQARAQVIWESFDTPRAQLSPVIWKNIIHDSVKQIQPPTNWEIVPEPRDQSKPSSTVVWEVLENEDEALIPPTEKRSNTRFVPPENLEEAEALLDIIPLQPIDFKPILNLSHIVPTATVLSQEEWRLITSTISPFKNESSTGNHNYAVQLDYGLSDTFQISGFYSEADNPNAQTQT